MKRITRSKPGDIRCLRQINSRTRYALDLSSTGSNTPSCNTSSKPRKIYLTWLGNKQQTSRVFASRLSVSLLV
ncbi:hypothetical protein BRADI_5g20945v3 [Brachypodium distachyon]|uniref:Uncharacterized protein n=1 Tax=Brachypodium distachyon TaxID=15368 RepID=A0A0Q3EDE6_BRADI|nr:hypothetical protein BRADI_5g20945v3 [Brachypodium distachyon]